MAPSSSSNLKIFMLVQVLVIIILAMQLFNFLSCVFWCHYIISFYYCPSKSKQIKFIMLLFILF